MDPDHIIKVIICAGLAGAGTAFVFRKKNMNDDTIVKAMIVCLLSLFAFIWFLFEPVVYVVGGIAAFAVVYGLLPLVIEFLSNTTADIASEWRTAQGKSPPRSFEIAKFMQENANEFREMGIPETDIRAYARWLYKNPNQLRLFKERQGGLPDGRGDIQAHSNPRANGNGEEQTGRKHKPAIDRPGGGNLSGGQRQQDDG